jgi:hypothetical protein
MPDVSITKVTKPIYPKPAISIFAGDTINLKLSGLTPQGTYNTKTLRVAAKKGYPSEDLTLVANSLPAFADTGNLTQVLSVDSNGNATIVLSASQTLALVNKQTYTLELEIDLGNGVIETYGQYELFVEQQIPTNGVTAGIPVNFSSPSFLGSGTALNFDSGNYFTRDLSGAITISLSNPHFNQTVYLETTNTAGSIPQPTLPANCDIYTNNWDGANNARNLIAFLCIVDTVNRFANPSLLTTQTLTLPRGVYTITFPSGAGSITSSNGTGVASGHGAINSGGTLTLTVTTPGTFTFTVAGIVNDASCKAAARYAVTINPRISTT